MTAVLPKLEFEVRKGDIVQFGLSISNSEIGQGALEVALYALRLVCLNGMTMPDNKTRKNHIGGRLGEQDMAAEYFADDTRKLADKTFFLKLRDVTRHMLTEGAVEQSVEQMRRSAGMKLDARARTRRSRRSPSASASPRSRARACWRSCCRAGT